MLLQVQQGKMEITSDISNDKTFAMQQVIKKLRAEDLDQGHCFMIFDDSLPEDEAYYEYPNGEISVEKLDKHNLNRPREIMRVLNSDEIAEVKKKHEVFY